MKSIASVSFLLGLALAPLIADSMTLLSPIELRNQQVGAFGTAFARLNVTGLPALPNAAYAATSLASIQTEQVTIPLSETTGSFSIYQPDMFLGVYTRAEFLIAELPSGTPDGTSLSIVIPATDTAPEVDLCSVTASAPKLAMCAADVRPAALQVGQYLVKVSAASANKAVDYPVNWSTLMVTDATSLITGPGHVAAGATLPLRLEERVPSRSWPAFSAVDLRYFALILFDSDGSSGLGSAGILPIAWSTSYRFSDVNQPANLLAALSHPGSVSATLGRLPPGQSVRRAYFDVPATSGGNSPLTVFVSLLGGHDADVVWTVQHEDFPTASASPLVNLPSELPFPKYVQGDGQLRIDALQSGRWYIEATNTSATTAVPDFSVFTLSPNETSYTPVDPASIPSLSIAPGMYYNAQRSGHGVSLSQANGVQVLIWFTYLEDGTPTWYLAQAAAPAANTGWWMAPLYRSAWNGNTNRSTRVGSVVVTPTDANKFIFTWYVEDKSGSEVFEGLAPTGTCPSYGGAITNFTGAWFQPALSGSGMDVLALPEQQFNVLYFYDDVGVARWGVGSSSPFLPSSAITFQQKSGFCPACQFTAVTAQTLGSISVDYSSNQTGNLVTRIELQPPLSGAWNTDQPLKRLTGSPVCPQ